MGQLLRVVFVADTPDSITTLTAELAQGGLELASTQVATPDQLHEKLCQKSWELVVTVLPLARFPELTVLDAVQNCSAHVPVIAVYDTFDEAALVAAMRAGAADVVSRANVERFVPAVQRALEAAQDAPVLTSPVLASALDALPLPVFLKRRDGVFVACNAAFEAFVGRDKNAIIGRTVRDLWPEDIAAIHAQADIDLLQNGEQHAYVAMMPNTNAKPRKVRFLNVLQPNVGIVGLLLDITDRDRSASEMAQRNEKLEQRITDRTRELEHQIDEHQQTTATLNQRQRELTSLLETSRDISSILDLNELLTTIAQRAIALLNADECTLFRLDDTEQMLNPILSIGEYADEMMATMIQVGNGITGNSVASNRPILANNVHADPRAEHVAGTPENTDEHVMAAPLRFRDRVIGAMLVSRIAQTAFTGNELNLFVGFAQHAATAMQNAWLYQSLENYSEGLERAVKARTRELQKTKERVEAILSSSPDAILILDTHGIIETVNQTFSAMFGYTAEEVLQQSLIILAEPSRSDTFNTLLLDTLAEGKPGRIEITAQHRNGGMFDADVALAPFHEDGAVTGLICSIRNISALKEVERMKDAFVSNVSHELRTPITSLRLYHDLLIKNPARQPHYMQRIKRETSRLEYIIDDLLQLSRLDQGRVRLNPSTTDLNILTEQYITDRMLMAEKHELTLHMELADHLPLVHVDRGLVGQALSILLTNALNYTPAGGQITVKTKTCNAAGESWAGISVSDTGPGIPRDELSRLFTRFFRGSVGHNSGQPGTGLGLALFHEIVQLHHGWVKVHSPGVLGKGVTFDMWFLVTS